MTTQFLEPTRRLYMRKVVELDIALHSAVLDVAHRHRCKVKDLATVLIAYAMEHLDDAIHDADRLLTKWENAEPPSPGLTIVRVTRPKPD